jgi:hypothetical protein
MTAYGATGNTWQQMVSALTQNQSDPVFWSGGEGVILAAGTTGGATLTLQASADGTNWVNVDGVSLTAHGTKSFALPQTRLRVATTGGSPSWNVFVGKVVRWYRP